MPMDLSAAEAYKAVARISRTDWIWFRLHLVFPCRWKPVELNQTNIEEQTTRYCRHCIKNKCGKLCVVTEHLMMPR
jgi:hypothetical protein